MGRVVVTALGAAGWLAALALIVGLRGTRRQTFARVSGEPEVTRLARAAARVVGTIAGGLVAGVLVLGLGGRLMMRILASTSPAAVQGGLTEAEEVVGEVTVDGTVGLILFVGVLGGVVGVFLFALLRPWLPDRSLAAGAIAAAIAAGTVARLTGLLDPDSRDFSMLEPAWLATLLCVSLLVTYALLGAVLVDRFAASWPVPSRSIAGAAAVLPVVPLLLVPPLALVAVGAVAYRAKAPGAANAGRAGRAVVALAALAGGAYALVGAVQIVTGAT